MATRELGPSRDYPLGRIEVEYTAYKGSHKTISVDFRRYEQNGIINKKEAWAEAGIIELKLKMELKAAKINNAPISNGSLKVKTFKDILELYKNSPKKNGESRSLHGQNGVYTRLMEHLGHCIPEHVEAKLDELIEIMQDEEELSPATCNRHIAMAKAAVKVAWKKKTNFAMERRRLIPENYLEGYPTLPENNIYFRILSTEERLKLWNNLRYVCNGKDWLQFAYYFASCVPIRLSELINLTTENLDSISGFIVIEKTKNRMTRTIKIPESFLYRFRHLDSKATHLFHDDQFKPLGYWDKSRERYQFNRYSLFNEACRLSGIENYNFHKTRQEAVMSMYQQGFSEEEIMMIGGWSNKNDKSKEAFYHYFNREMALQMKMGAYKMDLNWIKDFGSQIERKVA